MTKDQKKKMLILDYKLDPENDFYVSEDEWGSKIILKRTGIDKIQAQTKMSFTIENLQVVPYGDKVSVTIIGRAVGPDDMVARTVVMTNPDNCVYPNYAEVAEKRCRHRLLLQLNRLYEQNIFSEIESDKWLETRNQYVGAVNEAVKMLKLGEKTDKKESRPRTARAGDGSPSVPAKA